MPYMPNWTGMSEEDSAPNSSGVDSDFAGKNSRPPSAVEFVSWTNASDDMRDEIASISPYRPVAMDFPPPEPSAEPRIMLAPRPTHRVKSSLRRSDSSYANPAIVDRGTASATMASDSHNYSNFAAYEPSAPKKSSSELLAAFIQSLREDDYPSAELSLEKVRLAVLQNLPPQLLPLDVQRKAWLQMAECLRKGEDMTLARAAYTAAIASSSLMEMRDTTTAAAAAAAAASSSLVNSTTASHSGGVGLGLAFGEWAKAEEEWGSIARAMEILKWGLDVIPQDENLLLKAVRLAERASHLAEARSFLARLKSLPGDKRWKGMQEGALLEARRGNTMHARAVLAFLMSSISWYGPVYGEAARLEERLAKHHAHMCVVERGLRAVPRYGPLWFAALRCLEREYGAHCALDCAWIAAGSNALSRELSWRLLAESSLSVWRSDPGNPRSFAALRGAMILCPGPLRWRLWITAARLHAELGQGTESAICCAQSLKEAPRKSRLLIGLEWAHAEEVRHGAQSALLRLRLTARTWQLSGGLDWKASLEQIMLLSRHGEVGGRKAARYCAEEALQVHAGTGRLWAALIALNAEKGEVAQVAAFGRALLSVPKSGEVWTEGARLFLNPAARCFNLQAARRCLDFAIQFTPQYGDAFIEMVRLELLEAGPQEASALLSRLWAQADPNYGSLWFFCSQSPLATNEDVLNKAFEHIVNQLSADSNWYVAAILRSAGVKPSRVVNTFRLPGDAEGDVAVEDFARLSVALPQASSLHCDEFLQLSPQERVKLIYGTDVCVP